MRQQEISQPLFSLTNLPRLVQITLSLIVFTLSCLIFYRNQIGQNIINLLGVFLLLYGLDRLILFYRCYLNQSGNEAVWSFIVFAFLVLGLIFQQYNPSPRYLFVNQLNLYLTVGVLGLNLLYFFGMGMIVLGYFCRFLYRLATDTLLVQGESIDRSVLEILVKSAKGFTEIQDQYPNVNQMCSICFQSMKSDEKCLRLPECSHCFHYECIMTWLENKPTCPYCRSNINFSFL